MLVSGIQKSDSVIHIGKIFKSIFFYCESTVLRFLQVSELNSVTEKKTKFFGKWDGMDLALIWPFFLSILMEKFLWE